MSHGGSCGIEPPPTRKPPGARSRVACVGFLAINKPSPAFRMWTDPRPQLGPSPGDAIAVPAQPAGGARGQAPAPRPWNRLFIPQSKRKKKKKNLVSGANREQRRQRLPTRFCLDADPSLPALMPLPDGARSPGGACPPWGRAAPGRSNPTLEREVGGRAPRCGLLRLLLRETGAGLAPPREDTPRPHTRTPTTTPHPAGPPAPGAAHPRDSRAPSPAAMGNGAAGPRLERAATSRCGIRAPPAGRGSLPRVQAPPTP